MYSLSENGKIEVIDFKVLVTFFEVVEEEWELLSVSADEMKDKLLLQLKVKL